MTADEASIDEIVTTFYRCFSTADGRAPDMETMRSLFLPEALIVKNLTGDFERYDVASFIAPRLALLTSGRITGFDEWETKHTTLIEGNIAQRLSYYSKRWNGGQGPAAGDGVKSMQFVRLDGRWFIASLTWDDF